MSKYTNYKAGDLVECRKAERRVVDRLVAPTTANFLFKDGLYVGTPILASLSSLNSFIAAGYKVTVLERTEQTDRDGRDAKYFQDGWMAALREVRLRGDRAVGDFLNEQLGEVS